MMFLFVIAAPNSIAATQTAWMLGMLFWLLRFLVWPRPRLHRTPIDYPMFAFFLLTGLSAVLSYEPMVSIGKLRAASLFLIVYFLAENIQSGKILRLLTIILILATMVNVFFVFGQLAVGRGVTVHEVSYLSPLYAARMVSRTHNQPIPIVDGDTIEKVDGLSIRSADDLVSALDGSAQQPPARLQIYRVEWIATLEVARGQLLPGGTAEERLGIKRWSYGRDRRATGFYDHWTTYAESLQLLGSLVLGLFVALPGKRNRYALLLGLAALGISGALLLTVTRASWLSFLLSAILIAFLGLPRRALLVLAAAAIPLVLAGLFVLHQKRNVGFFDKKDDSIAWRQKIWHEGFHLLVSNPRHLVFGVGMDSIKSHWREWDLFEGGKLPMGHMHSDYLQMALERGLLTLIAWLALLGTYAWTLWKTVRRVSKESWIERGIVLGALGGLLGFMTSGFVHYNWGDSEVVMNFYLIMGLSLVVERIVSTGSDRDRIN
ncbi:MAG TPA: O-antigen ligase family protein [Pyrinomonadaceae bacterium]|nr:O-antigen ligase family protein [Pyrinomonadaceae bacterium]